MRQGIYGDIERMRKEQDDLLNEIRKDVLKKL